MLSGKVAATLGGYWNYEAIQLRQMHKNPVVIPIDQAGVPTYNELVLVVRSEEARTDGEDMRAFLQALTRGEQQVRANPAAAAALIVKANPSAKRSCSWPRSKRRCRRRCRATTQSPTAGRTRPRGRHLGTGCSRTG